MLQERKELETIKNRIGGGIVRVHIRGLFILNFVLTKRIITQHLDSNILKTNECRSSEISDLIQMHKCYKDLNV